MPKTLKTIRIDQNAVRAVEVDESGAVTLFGNKGPLRKMALSDFAAIEWADGFFDSFLRQPAGAIGAGITVGLVTQVFAYLGAGTNPFRALAVCAAAGAIAYFFMSVKVRFVEADGNQFVVNAYQPSLRLLKQLHPDILH